MRKLGSHEMTANLHLIVSVLVTSAIESKSFPKSGYFRIYLYGKGGLTFWPEPTGVIQTLAVLRVNGDHLESGHFFKTFHEKVLPFKSFPSVVFFFI